MAKKRRDTSPDYDIDFLQSYLDGFVQDSVALPAPIQNELAKVISQAYAGGQRGSNADVASIPFPTSGLIQNPDIIPQTIGDAERLLARSFYPAILKTAHARSAGNLSVDPIELITSGVERVMNAARDYDYTRGSFNNYAGPAIFGSVTGDARNATKPEQSGGVDDYWYNQLRTSLGDNTVQTQFYTQGGAPLIGPNGLLNASAAIDAGLAPTYMPAYLNQADVDRYIAAKESGLISNDPSVKRVESGLRKLNSNLRGGRGEGDNSFVGANSQEADAVSLSLPETRGNIDATLDALFHRETNDYMDATAEARMRHANGGRPVFGEYENDRELTGNRQVFTSTSMGQSVDIDERNAAVKTALRQIEEQGTTVPQVAYQLQETQERLVLGKVRSGFVERFKADNPELVALNKKQYNVAQQRVRAFEAPERVIPAQPLRAPVSDVGQSRPAGQSQAEPVVTEVATEPTAAPFDGPKRSDYGSLAEYSQARAAWLSGQGSTTGGEAAASAATSGGGSGSDEPPEAPPPVDEEFPEPRSNKPQSSTLPPHGYQGTLGDWFQERAGLNAPPSTDLARNALKLLNEEVPAYKDMFMGQWAKPDPAFDKLYESMTPEQQKAWNTLQAEHHYKQEFGSGNSIYRFGVLANPEASERWKESKKLESGEMTLEKFNAKFGTRGRDPVTYKGDKFTPVEGEGKPIGDWQGRANTAALPEAGRTVLAGAGGDEDAVLDREFPASSNWEDTRARMEADRQAQLQAEYKWEPGNIVQEGNIAFLKDTARQLSHRSLGGAHSSKLGEFTPFLDRNRQTVGGEYRLGGKVTANADEVNAGLQLARDTATEALGQGDLVGMEGLSAAATFNERFNNILRTKMKQLEKDVVEKGMDPTEAKEFASRVQEVAKDVVEHMGDGFRQQTGFNGRPGDFQYTATKLSGEEVQKLAASNAGFREHLINSAGSVEDAIAGPAGVYAGEGVAYRYGEGSVWAGRGRGGGSSGRGGGGDWASQYPSFAEMFPGEDPVSQLIQKTIGGFRPFAKSPYQSLAGHFMMTNFMADMAWQNTGGRVLQEANQYGMSQAYMSPMVAFGNGGVSGGAPAYAARMSMAEERAGEQAYNQYGILNEMGANFRGGAFAGFKNDWDVASGLGLKAGILSSAIGPELALPVGVGVTAMALAPSMAFRAANAITGHDAITGMSPRNFLRGYALEAGVLAQQLQGNGTDVGRNFLMESALTFGGGFAGGDRLTQVADSLGASEADVMKSGFVGQFLEKFMPGTVDSLAYSEGDRKAAVLSNFNKEIASRYQIDPQQSAKILQSLQVGLGGLGNDIQKDIAEKMVGLTLDTGKDQLGLYSQYASLRGVSEGSRAWQGGADTWVNTATEEDRVELLKRQQKWSQAYSQFSPYLEGGTFSAAQLADNFGLGHMASAQAFAQVASGFGMDYGRDMTDLEATGFAQMMQGQSPRLSMKLASIANNVAGLGAWTMPDTFATLSSTVAGGRDVNFLSELFSGNLYALSDWGQETGQGNLQYYQQNGQRMGTTDISGVLLGAQQRMGLPSSLTAGQTLGAMGLTFSSMEAQNALVNGGLQGYQGFFQNQMFGFQMASFGIQGAGIAANERYMYKTWDIEDKINSLQYNSQMEGFDYSLNRMDLQHKFQLENWAAQDQQRQAGNENNLWRMSFDYQTSLMQRDFTREGWNFQSQMSGLSFGWSMEDYDEAIRRSSGYERSQLIKKRDREVTSYNLNEQNTDRVRENQEELWQREDERYKKSLDYTNEMIDLEEQNTTRQREQYEELFQMERDNTVRRKEEAEELHKLQMEMQKAQREHQQEQIALSKASLGLQVEMAQKQHEYSENVRKFNESRERDEASMRKLIGYAPSFRSMIEDWLRLLDRMEHSNAFNPMNTTTTQVNGR